MKIAVCSSVDFTPKIKEIADQLVKMGHQVDIPFTSQKIISGKLTMKDYLNEKQKSGDGAFRKTKEDLIRRYYNKIKTCDAILVVNLKKKGIKNYIGGNTFLEMGFAHVLNKKLFLLNDIPDISYMDEIKAMQPVLLNGDFSKIK